MGPETQLVAAIIAACVALVVAVLSPALESLRSRRQAIADKFDEAVAALLVSQTARHYPTNPGAVGASWESEEFRQYSVRMQQTGLEYFWRKQEEARAALARLEPFVPELRRELTSQWEIPEERELNIRAMLAGRREEAIKSEKLLRPRTSLRGRNKTVGPG